MVNTKYLLYMSTCLLFSDNLQAFDIKLTYDSSGTLPNSLALHTQLHTPLELKPIPLFNSNNDIKLTSVCSVSGGGSCGILNFNSMGLNTEFQCTDEGYVRSCPPGQVKDSTQVCPHSSAYFKCRNTDNSCDDEYSQAKCTSEQVTQNSYTNESGTTCYQCRNKTCEEGGLTDTITSCQKGTAVSFANQTCYQDVTDKSCEDMGYYSAVPTNYKCTPITECEKSCQSDCHKPTCEETGLLSSCPDNHDCTEESSYGKTCYKDKGQPSCSDGGYKSGLPTNQVCSSVSYFGQTCYDDCYQPTCENGGYQDSVPTNNKCTPIAYYGRTCQKDCYQPQCNEGGYLDACPAGQSGTLTTYYGQDCYTNCKTETITVTPLPILYSDKTTANTIIEGKTPIGIVFDTTNHLAVALNKSPNTLNFGPKEDIPGLENCATPNNDIIKTDPALYVLSCSIDGRANTTKIIAYGKQKNLSYPAAEYCNNYKTSGTKVGDWHLPSLAELKDIYNNKTALNETAEIIGTSPLFSTDYNFYWSSTEYNQNASWHLGSSAGDIYYHQKDTSYLHALPVLAYKFIDADKTTCKMLGKTAKDDRNVQNYLTYCVNPLTKNVEKCNSEAYFICEKDEQIYQDSKEKLECYDCSIRDCTDPQYQDDPDNVDCSFGVKDTYKQDPLIATCIKALPDENLTDACNRIRNKWFNSTGEYPEDIIPLDSLEYTDGKCIVCGVKIND